MRRNLLDKKALSLLIIGTAIFSFGCTDPVVTSTTANGAVKASGVKPVKNRRVAGYAVQITASSNRRAAERMESGFSAGGYKTYINQTKINGNLLYQVLIGPFTTQRKALAQLGEMKGRYQTNPKVQGAVVTPVYYK